MKHWTGAGVLVLVGAVAVACSDDGSSTGAGGGGDAEINGCTQAAADDMTGQSSVTLDWSNPHQSCIRISAGTTVTFDGDFVSHPMGDGTVDGPSNGPFSGNPDAIVFEGGGAWAYYCTAHGLNMQGVIYVDE